MNITIEEILKLIKEADCVLVGVGKEVEKLEHNLIEKYKNLSSLGINSEKDLITFMGEDKKQEIEFVKQIINLSYENNINDLINPYEYIYKLVDNKNYFLISSNASTLIWKTNFNKKSVVTPCGNSGQFQCTKCNAIWNDEAYVDNAISDIENIVIGMKNGKENNLLNILPTCPECLEKGVFNNREWILTYNKNMNSKVKYNENGYLPNWKEYLMWLQRTLNKKLVLLEIGEDFLNPNLIRWPFEKTTFINEKATLIRINEMFPQISEEIKNKAYSYKCNAIKFLYDIIQ